MGRYIPSISSAGRCLRHVFAISIGGGFKIVSELHACRMRFLDGVDDCVGGLVGSETFLCFPVGHTWVGFCFFWGV